MSKAKKSEWIATIECVVKKTVYLLNCTEEEARSDPWKYSEHEDEIEMIDWKVLKVEPNE